MATTTTTTTVYTRDHRPPVVQSSTWLQVVSRADWRCQCVGQCGRGRGTGHVAGDERCGHEAAVYQLAIAPFEPVVSEVAACRVRAEYLQAWCGPCLDATVRAVRKARAAAATDDVLQLDLLDDEDVEDGVAAAGWSR